MKVGEIMFLFRVKIVKFSGIVSFFFDSVDIAEGFTWKKMSKYYFYGVVKDVTPWQNPLTYYENIIYTSPKASACPHLHYELAWTFLVREENALGRGSNRKKTDFSCHCPRHSWTWQSASLHGIAEDSQTLKDVFALVPFTKSHGEVSIQQINRSIRQLLSADGGP